MDLGDALAGGPALDSALARVREHLTAPPLSGIGHGLLRYLNPETGPEPAQLARLQIEFTYMGRFGIPEATDWSYAPGVLPEEAVRDLAERWFRVLGAFGALVDRAEAISDSHWTHPIRSSH